MEEEIFLKLEGIKKDYNGVPALKGIDLEIRKGEIHCLAGGNGCGKSTLIKIISGVIEPTGGKLYIGGKLMKNMRPIDAIDLGIQVIYQDFAVFPNLTAAENIVIGRQVKNRARLVDGKSNEKIALEAMEMIGAHIDPGRKLEDLTVADKQMVAICRAVINEPSLLILDEPTTALTAREVGKLWDIIRSLKEKGIAVLLVDHKLDEVHPIADRLTVIRNGEYVSSGPMGDYHHRKFIRDMTGHDISDEKYQPEPGDKTILEVDGLTRKDAYYDISFSLKQGDILGITGLIGSGRSEIAKALFGLCPAQTGRIVLHGEEITIRNIHDALKNKIAYVPEDRLTEGIFPFRSVADNMTVSSLRTYIRRFRVDKKGMTDSVEGFISKLHIVASSLDAEVSSLSGGNAQKVVISKWLNTSPRLLVLNGPTVGVDVAAKAEIHAILRRLVQSGVGIILITDDLPELVQNCNKILVVRNRRIVWKSDNSVSKRDIADMLVGSKGGAGA